MGNLQALRWVSETCKSLGKCFTYHFGFPCFPFKSIDAVIFGIIRVIRSQAIGSNEDDVIPDNFDVCVGRPVHEGVETDVLRFREGMRLAGRELPERQLQEKPVSGIWNTIGN